MMCPPLKGEIESCHKAVAPGCRYWIRANFIPSGFDDRVFVMEGYPGAAEHDRVPAISNRISVNIAHVQRRGRIRLPRHPNQLDPVSEDELWTQMKMGFDKPGVPCGSLGSVGKCPIGRSIRPEVYILVAMQKEGQNLEFAEVPIPREPDPVEGFVAISGAWDRNATLRQGNGRPLPDIGIAAKSLQAQFPNLERLAKSEIRVIAPTRGQVAVAVIVAQHGHTITSVAIHRMPCQFRAELVVAKSESVQ